MALSPRAFPVLAFALATLGGCEAFDAKEAGAQVQLQAQPGEEWLYSYANDAASVQTTLLMIDPVTGAAQPIGAPIAGFIDALAFDETNRVLYGAWRATAPPAPSELVTIDWHTGAVTFVGPLVTSDPNTPADAAVQGMSFAADGTLVGLTHGPERLVEIAPTADFVHVVDLAFPLDDYGATFVGPTLYAVNANAQDLLVIEVDQTTGAGTQHLQQAGGGVSVGATVDDQGTFYTVLGSELHTLDASFVPTLVADTGFSDLGSLAWIAELPAGPSVDDACPCDADWRNHGEYVKCVAHWANANATSGQQHGQIVSDAGRSGCGK